MNVLAQARVSFGHVRYGVCYSTYYLVEACYVDGGQVLGYGIRAIGRSIATAFLSYFQVASRAKEARLKANYHRYRGHSLQGHLL